MSHGKKTLVIVGAGGHGKVAGEIAELCGRYQKILYLDNDAAIKSCLSYPVMGRVDAWVNYPEADLFIAIGTNATRQKIAQQIGVERLTTLVHSTACVSQHATLGKGCVVMAGAVVGVDSHIGNGCIINTGATVDHECMLADYVHISPGAHLGGQTIVGERSWLGIGSSVVQNATIAADILVGAGGVVIRDLTEPGTYVGLPAKLITKDASKLNLQDA
jgi:sugar O-acyltransferase (sialic acid O-acetyltransferase NeuD family)